MTRRWSVLRSTRLLAQVGFLLAAGIEGVRLARGESLAGVERYCPFGGLETAWSFVTRHSFSCTAGELNLALFLALLGLTLVARKAFCSWVCPVGSVSEWLFRLVRRPGRPVPVEPPAGVDRVLRWLRLPVLGVILVATWTTGELVFRGYDPYYILVSARGHDVRAWSYAILAGVLALGMVVPMAWCRYLCPLGVTLWPFAAVGRIRLRRNERHCTACAACTRACPHGIDVAASSEVRSGECTLCLECSAACPSTYAMELRLEGWKP